MSDLAAWLDAWRLKIEADDFASPDVVRTHFVEIHRLLLEIADPERQAEARAALDAHYARRLSIFEDVVCEGDEIPGPPACAGGGCGED